MQAYYGKEIGIILFRKHIVKYIMSMPMATELRPYLLQCDSSEEILELVTSHVERIQEHKVA